MSKNPPDARINLRRRAVLAGAGLSVSFVAGCTIIPPIPKRPQPTNDEALGWVQLSAAGRWVLWLPRVEMGQNISGALREVCARELEVSVTAIEVKFPSTDDIGRVKATVGSDSVRELTLPIARACFVLRNAVMERAGLLSGEPAAVLKLDDQVVVIPGRDPLPLAQLAKPGLRLIAREVATSQLRFFSGRTAQSPGKVRPAVPDHEAIVRGLPLYTADVRLPKMVYATVLRSPWPDTAAFHSRLLRWDVQAVRNTPGFLTIIEHPDLAGPALVSSRIGSLQVMRQAANAKWSAPPPPTDEVMTMIDIDKVRASGGMSQTKGYVLEPQGAWDVDLRLDVPLASHACIEPRCAVAHPSSDGVELWCGNQDIFYIRDVIARDTGLPLAKIKVHSRRIGGSFGGKTIATVEREAALIAIKLGRPVKVQWLREDEFVSAFGRQPSSQRIQVRLGPDAQITNWRHDLSTSHVFFTNAILPPWLQRLTNFIGDDGASRGHTPIYGFDRQQLGLRLTRLPVLTGPWRGLGAGPNVLAIEMAMDQAARKSRQDPFDFRLKHLKGSITSGGDPQRLAQCLQVLRKRMNSAEQFMPAQGAVIAHGIAAGSYKAMSYAAAGAEVMLRLDARGRAQSVEVTRIWCTHDCGQVIDPSTVRAMIEGNLVWCIGMVLHEELETDKGQITTTALGAYRMPRISDVPPMDIELIDSAQPATGAGETAMVAGAGAIANAIARVLEAVGQPMPRRLPISFAA
jgi:isoquinoline 1-oxidoreductase subunit beta